MTTRPSKPHSPRRTSFSAFRGAVAGEMLDAGRHRGGVQRGALIAPDHGLGHPGVQPGVLSASFRDAAPARVPGDVQHRREGPSDPLPGRLDGRHAGSRLHEGGVEGRRQAQRDGEYGMEPVDDVPAHEERNPEPGLLHADALEFIDLHGIHLVQDGPDLALAEGVGIVGHISACGDLVHLADLLGQGHPGQELVHAALDFGGGTHRGGLPLLAGDHRDENHKNQGPNTLHFLFVTFEKRGYNPQTSLQGGRSHPRPSSLPNLRPRRGSGWDRRHSGTATGYDRNPAPTS